MHHIYKIYYRAGKMTFLAKTKTAKNPKGQYITLYICLKKKRTFTKLYQWKYVTPTNPLSENKQAQLCFQHVSSYTSATERNKVLQALKDFVCHRSQI